MAGLDLEDLVHPILKKQVFEEEKTENESGSRDGGDVPASSDGMQYDPKVVTNVHVADLDDDRRASAGSSPVGTLIGSPIEASFESREENRSLGPRHSRDADPANSGNRNPETGVSLPPSEETREI